jgi:PRTRC genetic system protein B
MNKIYTLNQAMTLYKSDSDYFFQIHNVFESKGEAILGAGKPLTREALEVICKAVLPTMIGNLTFLNGRILGSSGTIHGPDIWWAPPAVRPMFFTGQIKISNRIAPWPGLVFVTQNEDLSALFAVKGDVRPTLETELYVAPFFNMTGYDLCLGSARHPAKNNSYDEWEAAVYTSAFSEERLNEQRIAGTETLSHFWKERITKKETIFPEDQLLPNPSPKTIKQLIEALKKGKENL